MYNMNITVTTLGKVVLKCPRNGKDVILHKQCFQCDFYKHFGLYGSKIMVTCQPDKLIKPERYV